MMTGTINSLNTPDELLQAYTAMFLFLGGAISMAPEESGLPYLCDAGLLRQLPVESHNKYFEQSVRLLRSPCPHKQTCQSTIAGNYSTLFEDNSKAEAYPAASHWKDCRSTSEECYRSMYSIYSKYGYRIEKNCNLGADHLGIQLLFTNLLIEKFLTVDDEKVREITRKDLIDFISNEMLSWLPQWVLRVSEKSVTKCYAGISGLIIGGLEDVRDILKTQKFGL